MKFNVYAGLGGSFGGAQYQGTGEFTDIISAVEYAYQTAIEEYQSYEGLHGIMSWYDVACENGLDPDDEKNEKEIDELYNEELENWIEYYAILTEEDEETSEEELFEI